MPYFAKKPCVTPSRKGTKEKDCTDGLPTRILSAARAGSAGKKPFRIANTAANATPRGQASLTLRNLLTLHRPLFGSSPRCLVAGAGDRGAVGVFELVRRERADDARLGMAIQ